MNTPRNSVSIAILIATIWATAAPSSNAATILSQNFDTDPVNYTVTPSVQQGTGLDASSKYWGFSNEIPTTIRNPNLLGNTTNYLTGQNMDAPLPFDTFTPGLLDFVVFVGPATDLKLSIDLAGLLSPEPENYVRCFTDNDGDGFYETQIFNFQGTGNLPYTETTTGQTLNGTFQTFANWVLPQPDAADKKLRVQIQMFNDTDSQNEAIGIDNIVITGVPEPTTGVLIATGLLACARRRVVRADS
jgi:hypothetical protein